MRTRYQNSERRNCAEFSREQKCPAFRSIEFAFVQLSTSPLRHALGSLPRGHFPSGAKRVYVRKGQAGDEGLHCENPRDVDAGTSTKRSGNRSGRKVSAGGAIHPAGRKSIGDGGARQRESSLA